MQKNVKNSATFDTKKYDHILKKATILNKILAVHFGWF
jgi:hypothetical protein